MLKPWDNAQFYFEENVPILDEHNLALGKRKDGKATHFKVDRHLLQQIADNNNKRVLETGDLVPVVVGLTKDDADEKDQPEIVGFADQFSVGPLLNAGHQALHCRMRFFKDKIGTVNAHPRRSVELWLDRKEVDPISLLGATAPERNLGLLRLSRSRESLIVTYGRDPEEAKIVPDTHRTKDLEKPAAPQQGQVDPAMVQAVMAALMQTDQWKRFEAASAQGAQTPTPATIPDAGTPEKKKPDTPAELQQPGAGDSMGGGGAGLEGGDEDLDKIIAELFGGPVPEESGGERREEKGEKKGEKKKDEGKREEKKDEKRGGDKVEYEAGCLPGGSNTFVPSTHNNRKEKEKMARDKNDAGETVEEEVVRLRRERDQAIGLARKARIEAELKSLRDDDGIDVDVESELPLLVDLNDSARQTQYDRMRRCYRHIEDESESGLPRHNEQHNPGPRGTPLRNGRVRRGVVEDESRTTDERDRAVELACRAGIEYEEALERVRNGNTDGKPTRYRRGNREQQEVEQTY